MAGETRLLSDLVGQADGDVTYLPLCEQRASVPLSPRFIFGDVANDLMRRYYSESVSLPVGLFEARRVDLAFVSLLIKDGAFLRCDELQMHPGMVRDYIEYHATRAAAQRVKVVPGTCVLLLGIGYYIYGHWLADFLPKLFVLHQAGHDLTKLRYLVPHDAPDFGLELLSLLGIGAEQLIRYHEDDEIIRADRLLIPTMVRTNSRTSPLFGAASRFLSSLVWSRNPKVTMPDTMRRIYVSRALADRSHRDLTNRDRIEQIAAERGFAIVHPEKMPLLDQFAMFDAARQIAGEYGSAMHGSMFSSAGPTVGLLRGTGSAVVGFLQSAIGEALGQPTGYVFGPMIEADPHENFSIDEDAWRACIDLIYNGPSLA